MKDNEKFDRDAKEFHEALIVALREPAAKELTSAILKLCEHNKNDVILASLSAASAVVLANTDDTNILELSTVVMAGLVRSIWAQVITLKKLIDKMPGDETGEKRPWFPFFPSQKPGNA